jgi:hypothetical protein
MEERAVTPIIHQSCDPIVTSIAVDAYLGRFGTKEIGSPLIKVPGRQDVKI